MGDVIPYNQWLHLHDDDIKAKYPERRTVDMVADMDMRDISNLARRYGIHKTPERRSQSQRERRLKEQGLKQVK